MKLRTTHLFNATPDMLWPLMFNSKMDDKRPSFFLCGLPKPLECRLTEQDGGVGKTRECISDKGIITQEILEWEPNKRLKFRLKETTIYFGQYVKSIVENFEINSVDKHTSTITRTTEFKASTRLKYIMYVPMFIGLKAIHRYVFRNWQKLSAKPF